MLSRDAMKSTITIIGLALTVLTLAWRGGSKLATIDESVSSLVDFKKDQGVRNHDQDLLNQKTSDKLTRVETMMEMVVRGMGMNPPARHRGHD